MELKKIFTAESKSTWDVLNRGIGFYIPPYQREYDWDEGHIKRLFEDISHGLMQLLRKKEKDSITFIGTLIVIDDARPETIAPNISRSDIPDKILSVIDGQQRLTTILLMNICLHDEIRRRSIKFEKGDTFAFEWLYDRINQISLELQETFEEDKRRGEGVYQWQPRMIRAYVDSWARSEREAKYKSPIAAFIHGYSKHIYNENENKTNKPYMGEGLYTGEGNIDKSEVLWTNYETIRNLVEEVSGVGMDLKVLRQAVKDYGFQEAILREKFPEDVRNILSNEGNDDFKELIWLVLFANFLMNWVGVTVVSAPGAYAFDMFESLNTTGEPLTIFETFRPKVIESEGLNEYEDSDSRKYMRPIEKYFGQFDTAQKRQKETAKLLIPFALAESGKKLPSDPRDQRQYMRNQYESLVDREEKRNFVQHLSHMAEFMTNAWKQEHRAFSSITEFTDRNLVLMCMDVLGKADHHITIGPLTRFYSQVLLALPDSLAEVVNELEEAIKAMTAFFALWRGSGRTTGGLADQYRELMEKGFNALGIRPFCRCENVGETSEILTAEELRKALRYALGKGRTASIASKADWVRLSSGRTVVKDSLPLTRFLLFAATHDTAEDDKCLGLPRAGRKGILNMLTWEKWNQDLTIEHVAPQGSKRRGWPERLYEKPDLVDYLGNLTLLPKAENSSFSNRPWSEKKEMYCILSSSTQDELDTRLTEAEGRGIQLSDSTKELLRNGRYFQHLSTICNVEKWDDEFVEKRSRRSVELVWTNIAPWLGFDKE